MAKIIDMTESQPGTPPGISVPDLPLGYSFRTWLNSSDSLQFFWRWTHETTAELTAVDIAKRCGFTSDRWTRERRGELEAILSKCRDGDRLIAALKASSGNRYTQFAFELIQEQQRLTSTGVPLLKDGKPVFKKGGVVQLRSIERVMLPSAFEELLLSKFGKAPLEEGFDPEHRPEDPPGSEEVFEGEIVDQDPEETSDRLEFEVNDQTGAITQIKDDTAAIAGDTFAGISSFEQKFLADMKARGEKLGAQAAQQFALGLQSSLNQGTVDLNQGGVEQKPPTTTRKTVKKKS